MKEVVQQPKKTVNLNAITNDSIVGIEWQSGKKGFIVEKDYYNYQCLIGFSIKNNWSRTSKQKYVRAAIEDLCGKAYVFDTKKELYKWLSE